MKRFILWAMMLTLFVPIAFADATINYVGCTPASGTMISSFNFYLEFNVTDPPADYGIGWSGYYNAKRPQRTQAVELYEGDKESGVFLARTMTSTVDGLSSDFQIGNKVHISFPDIIPEKGKTYNIYISNQFTVNKKNDISFIGSNCVDFYGDGDNSKNLQITYVGDSGNSETLLIESTSLRSNQDLDILSSMTYTFNNPVSVSEDAKVQLKEGESVIATSTKCEQTDEKSVTFSFDNVELLLSHSYVLALPEGTVSMASDSNQKNQAFNITLNGSMSKLIEMGTVTPSTDQKQILSSVKASFNVPNGYKFNAPEGLANKYVAKLYQSEISEENLLALMSGEISQGNTVVWTLPNMSLIPETKYILYVPEGQFWVYDTNNKRANEYSNEEINLVYTTPSIEEAGYAPMELDKPTLRGGSTVVNDGDIFSSIDRIEIAAPNLKYEYDGIKGGFFSDDASKKKGVLYDITDKEPVLVKEFLIDTQNRETATEYYNILCLFVNSILYEGREYRIVMPEGAFTIGSQRLWNYVRTPEFSITVKGATPTEVRLLGTSIADGAECSSLSDVIFNFNGDLAFDKEAVGRLRGYDASGNMKSTASIPLTAHKEGSDNITMVSAHASYPTDGSPRMLRNGYSYTLTIPAGCLYVESMPEIANKETILNIKGVEAPPVITEPEYVSLQISYLGDENAIVGSSSTEVVKGKTVSISVPSKDWNIASLMRYNGDSNEGTELKDFAESGLYTSSALNDNARFEVSLEYAAPLVFSDITTGVAVLPDSNIQVFSDNEKIVVKGLTGGELITVYTMAGIAVGSHESASDKDTVNIEAPKGQTYIVRVQKNDGYDYAAKIMH